MVKITSKAIGLALVLTTQTAYANELELRSVVENLVGHTAFIHVQSVEDWSHCGSDIPKSDQVAEHFIGPVCWPELRYETPRNQFSASANEGEDVGGFRKLTGNYHPLDLGIHKTVMVMSINDAGLPDCDWHVQYRSWITDRTSIFHTISDGVYVDGLLQDACFIPDQTGWKMKYNMAVIE